MTNHQSPWLLRGSSAQLTTDLLAGTIDIRKPECGISAITSQVDGSALQLKQTQLLGVRQDDLGAMEAIDDYVRGDDLIVGYRLVKAPDIGLQIYWRLVRDEAARLTGIEAIVSAQTELLDADPTSSVSSRLPNGDVLQYQAGSQTFESLSVPIGMATTGSGAILVRLADAPISILEMVHPSDDLGATIKRVDQQIVSSYPILTERLEKGVIRRSRVRTMLLPQGNDLPTAVKLYQGFALSPLPLTT